MPLLESKIFVPLLLMKLLSSIKTIAPIVVNTGLRTRTIKGVKSPKIRGGMISPKMSKRWNALKKVENHYIKDSSVLCCNQYGLKTCRFDCKTKEMFSKPGIFDWKTKENLIFDCTTKEMFSKPDTIYTCISTWNTVIFGSMRCWEIA